MSTMQQWLLLADFVVTGWAIMVVCLTGLRPAH